MTPRKTGTPGSTPTAAMFRTLELRMRRFVSGRLQGDHRGLRLGPGSDPEEVVRYRPGEDDVRRIDWNVTARSTEPHVWRSRAEHELDTWVLLDDTPSMAFGTVYAEKADVARETAAAVALLTDRPGNRVGLVTLAPGGLRWSRPVAPRRGALQALHRPATPASADLPSPDLATAVRELDRRERRPGLRVVVSDFLEPDGRIERPFPWEPALRRLATRHEVVVVEVIDPRELELVDVGPVVLLDPETGHRCEVWTSLPKVRQQYAAGAAAHRAAVAEAVRATGSMHLRLRTDEDWLRALARQVSRAQAPRNRRRRAPDPGPIPTA